MKTTIKSGIDPHGIPEMFKILLEERKSNPSAVDAFFASHPLEEDRDRSDRGPDRQVPQERASGSRSMTPSHSTTSGTG